MMQFPTQQVMALNNSPTYRMALSQRLQQSSKDKNDGTLLGGAASLFDAYLAKREKRKDSEEQGKLSKALMAGLTKEHHVGTPEELGGEGLTTMEPGVDNALRRIEESGLAGTERGGRLTQMLAMQRLAEQRQAAALADQRAYVDQQTAGQRDWQTQQAEAQRQFQMDMLGRQQAFQRANRPAPKPQLIKAADGHIYDANTGQRAFPNVQAAPQAGFQGNNLDGQAWNFLTTLPPDDPRYLAAFNHLKKAQIDHKTGQLTVPSLDGFQEPVLPDGSRAKGGVQVSLMPRPPEEQEALQSELQLRLRQLDETINHPGFDANYGLYGMAPNRPGSEAASAGVRIQQLQGAAFLRAYEGLKGGGQITEIEGKKAEQAIARLGTSQSPEEARAAITELREIIVIGAKRAGLNIGSGAPTAADPLGLR